MGMGASEKISARGPIPLHLVREFLEDGVVVIPNVLDAETIHKARASFHASLKDNYDVDVSDLRNSCTALSKLSTTGGAGDILDIFYDDWKLSLNQHPNIVLCLQTLWRVTYARCHGIWGTPFGPFDASRGYMYIDRCCFRVPNSIIDSQNTLDRRKKLQRSLTPHLDCCPHSIFEASDKQIPKWRPIQAFIALTDTLNKNEGGFEACRGLHAEFDSWNADRRWSMSIVESDKSLPPPCISEFTPIRPKEDNNILRKLDHVPCRAGGMTVDTYFLLL